MTARKLILLFICLLLCLGFTACAGNSGSVTKDADQATETIDSENTGNEDVTEDPDITDEAKFDLSEENAVSGKPDEVESEETRSGSGVLVVYFSATGTTKGVAERIASVTDADIYRRGLCGILQSEARKVYHCA